MLLSKKNLPLRFLLMALAAVMLSGCTMRALVGVNVNPDGSGLFEVSLAFDEELRTLIEQESDEPIDWSDPASFEDADVPADIMDELPEGATVEPYSEEDFEGFTVSVDFASLEELEDILADMEAEGQDAVPLRVTSEDGERFELSTDGDIFGDMNLSEEETEFIPPSMLADLFDIQLRVQLPGEIVSTNADETTDAGVMVWRLDPLSEEPTSPAAVSEVSAGLSTWIIIAIVVVALAVVAIVAILLWRRGSPEPAPAPPPAA